MRIDIGCGSSKESGYLGIDRVAYPGVDIVCDINEEIPLPDNTAEFVMASRVLPYVNDLIAVMAEIYRISTHKAVVCILAPYAHSYSHSSNPFFKQKFDEYTPRYLTASFFQPSCSPLSPVVPDYPVPPPPFDYRLLRMELFYQYPFDQSLYETEELDVLKTLQANVVHEIMYHFTVIKKDISQAELEAMSRIQYPEPHQLLERRRLAKFRQDYY
ncbi:methyltransferase domain-containing protein [Paenibacillus pedocola]|uniref:methyltransferase domain-containing protein n=1 Tax=Paenibacillus pedocola TaxID=3242193 RepID=UPI002877680D|nr:methyltransferase domain-containing protein [Paenibacillus typhae]